MCAESNGSVEAVGRARRRRRRARRSTVRDVRARRCGSSSGSPAGTTAVAARRQVADQLGLRRGDRLDRAEQLEVHRPDVDDHADVGLGDRASSAIWPAPRIAISSTSTSVPARRAEDRQRQPDLGVAGSARSRRRAVRLEHRREHVLGRGLAGRAGDADDARAELAAPGGRQALQRRERVVGDEHGARRRGGRAPSRVPRRRRARPTRRRRAPAAANAPPSCVLAGQADEQVAGADLARVDHDARRTGPGPGRGRDAAARPRRPRSHAASRVRISRPAPRAAPRARRSRRRTDLAPAGELLALLVALAGDHDDVAGAGALDRARRSPRAGPRSPRPSPASAGRRRPRASRR